MKKLFQNKLLKNVLTLLTGTTIAQIIPIVISPILSRLYTPDDFGLLAIFISITSILTVIATARYELAIMLPKDDEDAKNLVGLLFFVSTILSILILIACVIWGKSISLLLGNQELYPWLYLVPISVLLSGVYQALNYWSNRKKKYKRLAFNRVLQTTTNSGTNVIIGSVKNGAFGLICGTVLGQFVSTIRLFFKSTKYDKLEIRKLSFKKMRILAKRYDQFPKISIWSALLNSISIQMPVFILSSVFSSTIVGWYSLSHKILNMPMSVLGSAVGQVFFQISSNIKNEDPSRLKNTTYNTYKNMLFIGLIPMSIIFAFGDVLFAFIFGKEWRIAGEYARILSVWLLLVFVSSPLSLLFTVLEKEGTLLLFNIGIFLSRVISLLVGAFFFRNDLITVFLYAITGIVFWAWHCLYLLNLVGVKYRKSIFFTIFVIVGVLGGIELIRFILLQEI